MHNTPKPPGVVPAALMPLDLPPLSDSGAVEVLDFLHELVFRFEAHYFGQIHRHYDQQRDIQSNPPSELPIDNDDVPF